MYRQRIAARRGNRMSLEFPSPQFDDAVAAVCDDLASNVQLSALNHLLRTDSSARDEYILRVELHSRLASTPDLFDSAEVEADGPLVHIDFSTAPPTVSDSQSWHFLTHRAVWAVGLAACLTLVTALGWTFWGKRADGRNESKTAVARLVSAVGAKWTYGTTSHYLGDALEPGWLHLQSGLVQVVFYNGARLVIQGPAELRLISRHEAFCQSGVLSAEVVPRARGFCITTPKLTVVDLGTTFGVEVRDTREEVHVFKGKIQFNGDAAQKQELQAGEAIAMAGNSTIHPIPLNSDIFAKAAALQQKWVDISNLRYQQWRDTRKRLAADPSVLVHLDFERSSAAETTLPNLAGSAGVSPARPIPGSYAETADAAIVGCRSGEGRWPGKPALEFQDLTDGVRLNVPAECEALTLAVWVNVTSLAQPFNSLFMSDGFGPGKVHWQIRNDGVLDLGVLGPVRQDTQILAIPAVITPDRFGLWLHLAVVLDGRRMRVVHYVNGEAVSHHSLKLGPPYQIGEAELGNWNVGQPGKTVPPFFVRHFNGAMDEFIMYSRALSDREIRQLCREGKPDPDPVQLANDSQK
jgi:hypothetical protein